MKLGLLLTAAALSLAASTAAAQSTISPGMTTDQVRATFGAPATVRTTGGWTYWYYHNGCPNRCGSDDVVFFRDERVVAAVLRTARRRFAGPRASEALEQFGDATPGEALVVPSGQREPVQMRVRRRAPDEAQADEAAEPVRVGGVRVETEGADEEPGSTIIVRPPAREGSGARPAPTGTRTFGAVRDSAQGPPATAVDDARRAREGRVEPNTVRGTAIPDTAQSDRRSRERGVEPRVVPRNP